MKVTKYFRPNGMLGTCFRAISRKERLQIVGHILRDRSLFVNVVNKCNGWFDIWSIQAFLHGVTMPRKNHDHDPYFPSFTIAWSMVTVHILPNGQPNGHSHPRISPQWSGQWLLPSRIVYRILKIWEYILLFITIFTTFTAIFSFINCEIIKNSEPLLFSTENFAPSRFIF